MESFEKYPPDWADDEFGQEELDDEQENKQFRLRCLIGSCSRKQLT